jgi:amino acid permease
MAHHIVHIVYSSLKPELCTLENFKKVPFWSVTVGTIISVTTGFVIYMTFWENSGSNMFKLYQPTMALNVARMLLSVSSLLSFPLAFFSLRELLILSMSEF